MRRTSPWLALCAAALIAGSSLAPAYGASGGFSVSGKGGPFIKKIATRKLPGGPGGGPALGLASDAVNTGQFQAARLRMPQTEAKVRALLDKLDGSFPYAKPAKVAVYIVGIDYYSAYALPDGSIMVGFGLLDQAQSDDEIAFILGHELSHIRLAHFTKAADVQKQRDSMRKLGQLYTIGSAIGGVVQGGGSVGSLTGAAATAARQSQATSDLLTFLSNAMIEPSWSRNQEDEADALGFDLSQASQYSAETASARVFDRIQADADNRRATSAALNDQLKKEMERSAPQAAASAMSGGMSPMSIGMGLLRGAGRVASGVASETDGSGPKHRPPEERKKGIADYSSDAYPEGLPLRDESTAWLTSVRASHEYADAKIVVAAIRAAMKARADLDYATAGRQIAKATATSYGQAPMVLNEAARLRQDMGDINGADALFAKAHLSPDQSIDGYVDHARMLYRAGQTDKSLTIIQAGIARFNNDDKPFLALLVAVSKSSGRADEVSRYLKRCQSLGDPNLKKDCETAAAT